MKRNFNYIEKKLKILIIFILIINLFYKYLIINPFFAFDKNYIKVCLCTMGKEENLYAKEFIEYYIKLGFDHLFIYDNNDENTEKISDVLEDKYKDRVTIYEGYKINITNQQQAFTDCYKNNKLNYDWILMVDMDEFLYIFNDTLKIYLSNTKFKECDFIRYHWALASDNNLIHYDSRSLFERFKGPYVISGIFKTMVKKNISNLSYNIHSPKIYPEDKTFCDNEGNKLTKKEYLDVSDKTINIKKAYIIHFRFKSTEEFIKKLKRGYNNWLGSEKNKFFKEIIDWYFWVNKITLEKINYIKYK